PLHMGLGPLRVINDDTVAAGAGFGTHGHSDMEIISYVLSGELAHRDSLGNGSVIRPGNVQRMSAGTGVRHSEFNHATDLPTHFLQIWIEPDRRGLSPGYEEKTFSEADKRGQLRLIASPDGAAGSVRIHQDARIYAGLFDGSESAELALAPGRRAYVFLARGELSVNGQGMKAGDGARLEDESQIRVGAGSGAEVLLFDLP
ncbi:MAG: pirin family protein, partial [Burkholderiaceae bacterium]